MPRPSILGCAVLGGLLALSACKLPPAEGPEVAEQDEPDDKAVAAIPLTDVKQNTGAPRAQLVGTETPTTTTTTTPAPAETPEQKAARQAAEKLAKAKTSAVSTLLDEAAKLKALGDAGLATAADKMIAIAKEISPEAVAAYEAEEKAKAERQRLKEAEKAKPPATTPPTP